MQTLVKLILTTLVAIVIFTTGAMAGFFLRDYAVNDQPPEDASTELSLYWEVWNRVNEQFYGGVPQDAPVAYGAIKGSLDVLEDPYTLFLEPEPAAHEKADLEGQFGGVGAFVRRDEDGRVLLEPMRGQPAENAGMLNDDVLVAVDGLRVKQERLDKYLAGTPPGKQVSIQAFRRDELMEFMLEPEPAPSDTCDLWIIPDMGEEVVRRRNRWLQYPQEVPDR